MKHPDLTATTNYPATTGNASDFTAAFKAAQARRAAAGKMTYGVTRMTAKQREERRSKRVAEGVE